MPQEMDSRRPERCRRRDAMPSVLCTPCEHVRERHQRSRPQHRHASSVTLPALLQIAQSASHSTPTSTVWCDVTTKSTTPLASKDVAALTSGASRDSPTTCTSTLGWPEAGRPLAGLAPSPPNAPPMQIRDAAGDPTPTGLAAAGTAVVVVAGGTAAAASGSTWIPAVIAL